MTQYTYTPIQYTEDYVYKLKLERLMWKADARAWYHQKQGNYVRVERWESLYVACIDKLAELKK